MIPKNIINAALSQEDNFEDWPDDFDVGPEDLSTNLLPDLGLIPDVDWKDELEENFDELQQGSQNYDENGGQQ
jgi:hypothetical protein